MYGEQGPSEDDLRIGKLELDLSLARGRIKDLEIEVKELKNDLKAADNFIAENT